MGYGRCRPSSGPPGRRNCGPSRRDRRRNRHPSARGRRGGRRGRVRGEGEPPPRRSRVFLGGRVSSVQWPLPAPKRAEREREQSWQNKISKLFLLGCLIKYVYRCIDRYIDLWSSKICNLLNSCITGCRYKCYILQCIIKSINSCIYQMNVD